MADASLIFDASLDYSVSYKTIAKQLNRIVNSIESSKITKLKFSIDPQSLADMKKAITNMGLSFDPNIIKNITSAPIKIPTQFVGITGQNITDVINNLQSQVGKIASSPVTVDVNTRLDNNKSNTTATLEYINKDLGITEQRTYSIEEAQGQIIANLQNIRMLSQDDTNIVNQKPELLKMTSEIDNVRGQFKEAYSLIKSVKGLKGFDTKNISSNIGDIKTLIDDFNTAPTFEKQKEAFEKITNKSKIFSQELSNVKSKYEAYISSTQRKSAENASIKSMVDSLKKTEIELDTLEHKLSKLDKSYSYQKTTHSSANTTVSQINAALTTVKDDTKSFKERKKAYEELTQLVSKLRSEITNLNTQEQIFKKGNNSVNKREDFVNKLQQELSTYQQSIEKFKNLPVKKGLTSYKDISGTVGDIEQETNAYQANTSSAAQKQQAYENLIRLSKRYATQLKNLNAQLRNENSNTAASVKMTNLQSQVQGIWNKHGSTIKLNNELFEKFKLVQDKLSKDIGSNGGYKNVNEANRAVAGLKEQLVNAGVYSDALSVKMKKLFDTHLKTALTMMAVHALQQGFRELINNVKEVDSELTQLRIVTGESEYSIEKFADKAFKSAQKIGASATDIMKSTETWARLGYSLNDSLSLASTTAQFSNVGNISVEDATTSMTSILKAYDLDADKAQWIADILTNVGQKYAISASELGEALEAGGASLEAANNTLEQSVALLAAGNAAVQDSSKVGNALKTTTMRIRGATSELSDAGEEVDKFCESTSTMRKEIKALSGVEIMETDGQTFRSTYNILLDIAKVWDKLSDVSRANLLEAIAGKRNATVVKSIITNMKDLEGAYLDAQNASGTVEKSNAIFLDSIEGRLKQFQAQFQEFATATSNTDVFKGFISFGTGLINVLQQILTFGNGIILKIGLIIASIKLVQAFKIGKFMPAIPECNSNGRDSKFVNYRKINCWEVCGYYNYKAA